MIILANFLSGIAVVLNTVLDIYLLVILIRVVLSWVNADPYNPIVRIISNVTDPVLYWIRRKVPLAFGGVDFSPILVVCAIYFLQAFLVQSLQDYAYQIKASQYTRPAPTVDVQEKPSQGLEISYKEFIKG